MWKQQDDELRARFNAIPEDELRASLSAHADEECDNSDKSEEWDDKLDRDDA